MIEEPSPSFSYNPNVSVKMSLRNVQKLSKVDRITVLKNMMYEKKEEAANNDTRNESQNKCMFHSMERIVALYCKLGERYQISPIFMQRSLSYLGKVASQQKRKNFKVDAMQTLKEFQKRKHCVRMYDANRIYKPKKSDTIDPKVENSVKSSCEQQSILRYTVACDGCKKMPAIGRIENNRCPWCNVNCRKLNILLKHFRLWHSQFKFSIGCSQLCSCCFIIEFMLKQTVDHKPLITVAASATTAVHNHGSLTPPHRRKNTIQAPQHRRAQSIFFLYRRRYQQQKSANAHARSDSGQPQFLKKEAPEAPILYSLNDDHGDIESPTRVYYHSQNCQPIRSAEFECDTDSDGESEWLKQVMHKRFERHTFLNEGERNIMILWNEFMDQFPNKADRHMPALCKQFVTQYGDDILRRQLYRDFVLHLAAMCDAVLLTSAELESLCLELQQRGTKVNGKMGLQKKESAAAAAVPQQSTATTSGRQQKQQLTTHTQKAMATLKNVHGKVTNSGVIASSIHMALKCHPRQNGAN